MDTLVRDLRFALIARGVSRRWAAACPGRPNAIRRDGDRFDHSPELIGVYYTAAHGDGNPAGRASGVVGRHR